MLKLPQSYMNMPALPTPPPPPKPAGFQFSLRSILATMGMTAVVLAVLRAMRLDDPPLNAIGANSAAASIGYYLFASLFIGLSVYLCVRMPYLWTYLERKYTYARKLAEHRRQLLDWAEVTKTEKQKDRELADDE